MSSTLSASQPTMLASAGSKVSERDVNSPALNVFQRALDGLGVTLQRAFAPTYDAAFRLDTHEEPSWTYVEVLHLLDQSRARNAGRRVGLDGR